MAMQSIAFTLRQLGRAKAMAQAALAAPEGQQVALRVLAPDMIAQCDAYEAADAAARQLAASVTKEVGEGDQAVAQLREVFEQARQVIDAKLGVTYEAASSFPTADDLLNVVEDAEAQLEAADQTWAAPLLQVVSAALETAAKEQMEASQARKALQKAQLGRAQAEGTARPVLVHFRRLVRATFGTSSREYRELLDRRSRNNHEPDPVAAD